MKSEEAMQFNHIMLDCIKRFLLIEHKTQDGYEAALSATRVRNRELRRFVNREFEEKMAENRARKKEVCAEADRIVKDRALEIREIEKQHKQELLEIESAWRESRILNSKDDRLTYGDFMAAMRIAHKFLAQAGTKGLAFKWKDSLGRIDFDYQPAEKGGQDE